MLPVLALLMVTAPAPATADVVLHVVPYTDSNAWSKEHVAKLAEFLTWCREHNVKLAAFYFPVSEQSAAGVSDVLKRFVDDGTITVIGPQTVSHALGGLPYSIQYWEIDRSLKYTQNRFGTADRVLHVPYWVLDENTLRACLKCGVHILVSGTGPDVDADFCREKYPGLLQVNPAGRHMLVGVWRTGNSIVYNLPAMSFVRDFGGRADKALSEIKEGLRGLIQHGIVKDGDKLVLWLLLEPWQMDGATLREFEALIERISEGITLTVNGVTARIVLGDPRRVIENLESFKTVELPSPDYIKILKYEGYTPVDELQVDPEIKLLYSTYIDILRSIDRKLLAIIESGRMDGELERALDEVAQLAWNDAALCAAVEQWEDEELVKAHLKRLLAKTQELAYLVNAKYNELRRERSRSVREHATRTQEGQARQPTQPPQASTPSQAKPGRSQPSTESQAQRQPQRSTGESGRQGGKKRVERGGEVTGQRSGQTVSTVSRPQRRVRRLPVAAVTLPVALALIRLLRRAA